MTHQYTKYIYTLTNTYIYFKFKYIYQINHRYHFYMIYLYFKNISICNKTFIHILRKINIDKKIYINESYLHVFGNHIYVPNDMLKYIIYVCFDIFQKQINIYWFTLYIFAFKYKLYMHTSHTYVFVYISYLGPIFKKMPYIHMSLI